MKKILRAFLFKVLALGKPRLTKGASILAYHSVGNNNATFTVSEIEFRKQMSYLYDKGYKVVSLSDLIMRLKTGDDVSGLVSITFDDGYADNIENAVPILNSFNFPATIFVVTNLIGKEMINSEGFSIPILTQGSLSMGYNKIDFMPHTSNHVLLDSVSDQLFENEILDSRHCIERITAKRASIIAYPKGRSNERVKKFLQSAGFDAAVGVSRGLVDFKTDLFDLRRNTILASTTFSEFKVFLSNRIVLYNKIMQWIK